MSDFDIAEHRLVVLKPGDILMVTAGSLTAETAKRLKEELGLAAIFGVPKEIDIAAVRFPTANGQ